MAESCLVMVQKELGFGEIDMVARTQAEGRAIGWNEGVGRVKYTGFESKLSPKLANTLKTSPGARKRRDEGEDVDEEFGRKE